MQNKVEGLEQGLLTLSDKSEDHVRLKTTIHLLIMENNTLKKELSYLKSQSDQKEEEITRLKKKINHLVMKLDSQQKKFNEGNFQQIPEEENEQTSRLEEFEKIQKKEGEQSQAQSDIQKIAEIEEEEYNNVKRQSNFNLQGPYWKNRTNDILKQDRDKRSKLGKHD